MPFKSKKKRREYDRKRKREKYIRTLPLMYLSGFYKDKGSDTLYQLKAITGGKGEKTFTLRRVDKKCLT